MHFVAVTAAHHRLSLAAAAEAIRAGELTSEIYTQALLERIAATERDVEAWAHLDPESALQAARACDAEARVGPLAGIGIGVKDIVATRNYPTEFGSPIYLGANAPYDAECIMRLERAGGFVLGKTVTAEFSFLHPGKTKNPWRRSHTPGGSSSGSAAAVALGHVPAAIGEQTNGSIIRPAAFCGVVGFKPTRDAIPMDGVGAFSPTLDTLGVFARGVADCARLTACLADEGRIASELSPVERPHLAYLATFPWTTLDMEQQRAMEAAVAALEETGAVVTPVVVPADWREAHLTLRTIMLHEGAGELGELQSRERSRMSARLNAALDEGRAISEDTYGGALARREAMIAEATEWLAPFDAVLCAPARGIAPADLTQTGDPACCSLWSLLGFPALSVPIALAGGLPLGVQLASIAGGDDRLLAVAHWCEARLPFKGLA
jgi:Asp-tRNA(Asn)/Glu-tRNA(Gln) amidotransferase A subunit family amidase